MQITNDPLRLKRSYHAIWLLQIINAIATKINNRRRLKNPLCTLESYDSITVDRNCTFFRPLGIYWNPIANFFCFTLLLNLRWVGCDFRRLALRKPQITINIYLPPRTTACSDDSPGKDVGAQQTKTEIREGRKNRNNTLAPNIVLVLQNMGGWKWVWENLNCWRRANKYWTNVEYGIFGGVAYNCWSNNVDWCEVLGNARKCPYKLILLTQLK